MIMENGIYFLTHNLQEVESFLVPLTIDYSGLKLKVRGKWLKMLVKRVKGL